jgi:hypothetical protein
MIGASGRIYIAGQTPSVSQAGEAIAALLAGIKGREA